MLTGILTNSDGYALRQRALGVPVLNRPGISAALGMASGGPGQGKGMRQPSVPRVYQLTADGALVAKDIKIGISDGRFTEVLEGLAEGDAVVTRALSPSAGPGQTSGFRFRMF